MSYMWFGIHVEDWCGEVVWFSAVSHAITAYEKSIPDHGPHFRPLDYTGELPHPA